MYFLSKIKITVFILLLVTYGCTGIAFANSYEFQILLNQLKINDPKNELLNEWDKFLRSSLKFNNAEHIYGIKLLAAKYDISEKQLETYSDKVWKKKKNSTYKWLDDLEQKFGKDQIAASYNLIRDVLLYLGVNSRTQFCIKSVKEVLYYELLLKKSILEYKDVFFEFYNSLDNKKQQNLSRYKKNMELLSQKADSLSFQKSIGSTVIIDTLPQARMELNVDMNTPLAKYLIDHKDLSLPFSFSKAINDVKKRISK